MANGIALDTVGNIYVAGDTTSANFPATGFQKTLRGSTNGFIAKLAPDGSRLIYSSYLGGSSEDHLTAIAVDAAGSPSSRAQPIHSIFRSPMHIRGPLRAGRTRL